MNEQLERLERLRLLAGFKVANAIDEIHERKLTDAIFYLEQASTLLSDMQQTIRETIREMQSQPKQP